MCRTSSLPGLLVVAYSRWRMWNCIAPVCIQQSTSCREIKRACFVLRVQVLSTVCSTCTAWLKKWPDTAQMALVKTKIIKILILFIGARTYLCMSTARITIPHNKGLEMLKKFEALNGVIFSSPKHVLLNFGQTAILYMGKMMFCTMWGYYHQRNETMTSEDCSKIIILEVGGLVVFQLRNIYTIEPDLPFSQTSWSDLFSMSAINIDNCLTVFVQQYSVLRVHESKIDLAHLATRLRKSIPSYFVRLA